MAIELRKPKQPYNDVPQNYDHQSPQDQPPAPPPTLRPRIIQRQRTSLIRFRHPTIKPTTPKPASPKQNFSPPASREPAESAEPKPIHSCPLVSLSGQFSYPHPSVCIRGN